MGRSLLVDLFIFASSVNTKLDGGHLEATKQVISKHQEKYLRWGITSYNFHTIGKSLFLYNGIAGSSW
jgi:hypothetical protein